MERHDLDPISLVFGLAFTVLGLLFLAGPVAPEVFTWALPLVAVALGVGIVATARRQANPAVATPEPPAIDKGEHEPGPFSREAPLPDLDRQLVVMLGGGASGRARLITLLEDEEAKVPGLTRDEYLDRVSRDVLRDRHNP